MEGIYIYGEKKYLFFIPHFINYNATFKKNSTMGFDVTGKIMAKYDTVQRSEKFRTREFVIETTEDIGGRIINNYIKFQSVQDRTSLVDRFNLGDTVKVHFNIKGSKWEKDDKLNYITNLDAWRIENINMQTQDNSLPANNSPYSPVDNTPADLVDDLPF
jgi:Domain of unknown function (DUF3127)